MHPDLEALILAYDKAREGGPDELSQFRLLLSDFLAASPNVREEVFMHGLRRRHRRWSDRLKQHSALPPKA